MKLSKNMGTIDRIVRLTLVAAVVVLYVNGTISGLAAIVLGLLAVVFAATSLFGFCPLYAPFGLSTCGKQHAK